MRRYHVIITLSDGSSFEDNTVADSLEEAVDIITSSPEAVRRMGDNTIEYVQKIHAEELTPQPPERYAICEAKSQGYWVVTDQQKNIQCTFLERHFNDVHEITDLEGQLVKNPSTRTSIIHEMGEYLITKHPELIC